MEQWRYAILLRYWKQHIIFSIISEEITRRAALQVKSARSDLALNGRNTSEM